MTLDETVRYIQDQCPNGNVKFYHLLAIAEAVEEMKRDMALLLQDMARRGVGRSVDATRREG
jgi:hypothetical protein